MVSSSTCGSRFSSPFGACRSRTTHTATIDRALLPERPCAPRIRVLGPELVTVVDLIVVSTTCIALTPSTLHTAHSRPTTTISFFEPKFKPKCVGVFRLVASLWVHRAARRPCSAFARRRERPFSPPPAPPPPVTLHVESRSRRSPTPPLSQHRRAAAARRTSPPQRSRRNSRDGAPRHDQQHASQQPCYRTRTAQQPRTPPAPPPQHTCRRLQMPPPPQPTSVAAHRIPHPASQQLTSIEDRRTPCSASASAHSPRSSSDA